MTEWFGTDGVRGEANGSLLTASFIQELGKATGGNLPESPQRAVLASDGRISADLFENALGSGLMSSGIDVFNLGTLPTPGLSYLTRENDVATGLMISASHNPFTDNGVKGFQPTGEKWTPQWEEAIEQAMLAERDFTVKGEAIGSEFVPATSPDDYVKALQSSLREFEGHVVMDCANGATSGWAEKVFEDRCSRLTLIHDQPSGTNINENCGSLHPESLSRTVVEENADVGFAFDGDGDRVVAVDKQGNIVDGDVLLYMLAVHFSAAGKLPDRGLVITVMSNLGLRKALEDKEINYEVVGVGDRNVYNQMVDNGWRIGGEQSGHIIDRQWLPTGDGMRTACSVLKVLQRTDTTLTEWNHRVEEYPQVLHNIKVPQKPELERLKQSTETIENVEEALGGDGRVLVRYSGTEPLARIMLEGPDRELLDQYAGEIGDVMKSEIQDIAELNNDD